MFTRKEESDDRRLFSPYSMTDEDAVDHESLYLALCSRRQKACEQNQKYEDSAPSPVMAGLSRILSLGL